MSWSTNKYWNEVQQETGPVTRRSSYSCVIVCGEMLQDSGHEVAAIWCIIDPPPSYHHQYFMRRVRCQEMFSSTMLCCFINFFNWIDLWYVRNQGKILSKPVRLISSPIASWWNGLWFFFSSYSIQIKPTQMLALRLQKT